MFENISKYLEALEMLVENRTLETKGWEDRRTEKPRNS